MISLRRLLESIGPHSTPHDLRPLLDHKQADESHLLRVLRRRELDSTLIESIARHERWGSRHVIRAAIVNHPKTPKTLALRLVTLLFWKELLRVTGNVKVAMPVRIAAENRLRERLPELELGEKISIARIAPPGLFSLLSEEDDPGLVRALFENPRLRELDVLALVSRESVTSKALRVVSESERWIVRPAVKKALVLHANTPVHVALSILEKMPRREVRELLDKGELPPVIRLRAERRLEQENATRA